MEALCSLLYRLEERCNCKVGLTVRAFHMGDPRDKWEWACDAVGMEAYLLHSEGTFWGAGSINDGSWMPATSMGSEM